MNDDDIISNPTDTPVFAEILAARLSRRGFLAGAAMGAAATASMVSPLAMSEAWAAGPSTLNFAEISHGISKDHTIAKGYEAHAFIRWGDPVAADAPKFDPMKQTAAAQAKQFGYNNDFLAYMPLPLGSNNSDNGLLWVNHEYTEAYMMFAGLGRNDVPDKQTKEQSDIELAAHGASVVEIRKSGGRWKIVEGSKYNRRITGHTTQMGVSGPAAGHARLKTKADPLGTKIMGTLNNCAGGKTPWGTILTCEENFNNYFSGDIAKTSEERNYKRLGFAAKSRYPFSRFEDRFNVEKEPNEANRFGWVVEVDPYDPNAMPIKRTALGRFKHEGATTWVNPDGTVTIYSGDDQANDYLYKFVTRGKFDPINRMANMNLLDDGILYVAQFKDDGTVKWLPLVFGAQWLTPDQGFNSQADIAIETRRAADLLGATPMDRPEDVEVNPVTGRAYVVLTNNTSRKDKLDKANPRAGNRYGQILELIVPGEGKAANHAALEHKWDMFLMAGPAAEGGKYGTGTTENGWLACPDNIAFDNRGRMWIASDQGTEQPKFGIGDGIWVADTMGQGRAATRFFYRTPTGAEMCGPEFTPDNKTFFVAVQHPAADDDPNSTFDKPSTRWPDFKDNMPPRPAVVAITKKGGGAVGS